jgi:hypothetical protein
MLGLYARTVIQYSCLFVFQVLLEPDFARKKKDLKKQMKKLMMKKLMKKKLMKRLKRKMKEKLAKKKGQENQEMSSSCSDSDDSSSSDVSDDDSSSSDVTAEEGSSDRTKSGRIPAGIASVETQNGGGASSKFITEKNILS